MQYTKRANQGIKAVIGIGQLFTQPLHRLGHAAELFIARLSVDPDPLGGELRCGPRPGLNVSHPNVPEHAPARLPLPMVPQCSNVL